METCGLLLKKFIECSQHDFRSERFLTAIKGIVVADNAMAVPTQKGRLPQIGSSLHCKFSGQKLQASKSCEHLTEQAYHFVISLNI